MARRKDSKARAGGAASPAEARIVELKNRVAAAHRDLDKMERALTAVEGMLRPAVPGGVRRPRGGRAAGGGAALVARIMKELGLGQDELGRMMGVSGETIRRWKNGVTPVPASPLAELTRAASIVDRLRRMFRPDRLPLAIRRPAELFAGQTALEWILEGRLGEVADRYEASLAYQA